MQIRTSRKCFQLLGHLEVCKAKNLWKGSNGWWPFTLSCSLGPWKRLHLQDRPHPLLKTMDLHLISYLWRLTIWVHHLLDLVAPLYLCKFFLIKYRIVQHILNQFEPQLLKSITLYNNAIYRSSPLGLFFHLLIIGFTICGLTVKKSVFKITFFTP